MFDDDQRKAAAARLRRVSPIADDLGRRFARHGYELALVGGPVRDVFLGREPGDFDLTTNAPPSEILRIVDQWADHVWTPGIDFGTVGLRKNGSGSWRSPPTAARSTCRGPASRRCTTARRSKGTCGGGTSLSTRWPRGCPGTSSSTRSAAWPRWRRRCCGPPARRTSRSPMTRCGSCGRPGSTAKLDFTVADDVREAMTRHAGQLIEDVSVERITDELSKLMLTPDPARGIDLLVQTGVAARVLPEVPQLRLEADEHYRHKDVYQHSLTVLRQAIGLEERYGLTGDLVLRLAALLHDIGKPKTRSKLPDGRVAFHHHEVVGAKLARKRLTALRFPKDVVERRLGTGQAAPALPRVRRRGVDRFGRPPLRTGRRPAADPAERADPGRLHHQEQGQGGPAGPRLRRPGGADRAPVAGGGAGPAPARAQRQRHHADPRHTRWPAGRRGLQLPAGTADRRGHHRPGTGHSGAAALGGGRGAVRRRAPATPEHRRHLREPGDSSGPGAAEDGPAAGS